jgi:hypothetical protein
LKADYDAARAVPLEEDMNQILRCDRALQKKLDWALQNLFASRQERQKSRKRASVDSRAVMLIPQAD